MGFSIGKVFRPIENELGKYANVDSVYMPAKDYSLKGLIKNILVTRKAVKKRSQENHISMKTKNVKTVKKRIQRKS